MRKAGYPCPCGGKVEWKREKIVYEGIDCGVLDIESCRKCGNEYLPEESMSVVEKKLKGAGLWGVKRKEASLWRSGSSVLVRIPRDIAKELDLRPNEKVQIYTEGKNRLIIET